ncbi:MAG: NAD-dependent epimerase/dehydratase family protein [Candidatus Adiutrix sp.]|jgi:nucleoside-diphosphate-sugar epimerase|nr:NAD-dependent epimerase/dehydratase family protein [Candidatus Adiutrix sp.]
MKAMITGAAGFLGSELAKYLEGKGFDLVLLDNMEYGYEDNLSDYPDLLKRLIVDDVRNPDILTYMTDVDVVFHFAGISSLPECETSPQKAFEVNTASVAGLLSGLRNMPRLKRFIFASTSAVYENNTEEVMSEDLPLAPDLVYATTKLCAEHICRLYALNYDMDIVICRFFNVFGPHQDYKRLHPPFTSYLIREISNGRRPVVFNTSDVRRDYIYTEDLIAYLDYLMSAPEKMRADIFNLCSGHGHSALEIVKAVYKIFGREPSYDEGKPVDFWNKYPSLFDRAKNLSENRVKKEVYKNCIGSNRKIVGLSRQNCRYDLETGLKIITDYQSAQR